MPGGGYGYGGRPQCRDYFSLFSLRNLKRARLLPAFISIQTHTHTHILILIHACTHAAAEPDGHRYSSDQPGIWTRGGVRRGFCTVQDGPRAPNPDFLL
jgi:hypothetical protein